MVAPSPLALTGSDDSFPVSDNPRSRPDSASLAQLAVGSLGDQVDGSKMSAVADSLAGHFREAYAVSVSIGACGVETLLLQWYWLDRISDLLFI